MPSQPCSLASIMYLVHSHVKGYSVSGPPHWLPKLVYGGSLYWSQPNNKVSSVIPNNCGVLQGAVLSLFLLTLHTSYLYSESLASFFKYADDVIRHPCKDSKGIFTINNALKCVSDWSGDNGLNHYPNKRVQYSPLRTMLILTPISKLT